MEYLRELWSQIINIQITDILDIIIVAFLIYKLLPLLRSTGTMRIAKVVVTIIVIGWLTDIFRMHTLSYIINQFLAVGLLAVVIPFFIICYYSVLGGYTVRFTIYQNQNVKKL